MTDFAKASLSSIVRALLNGFAGANLVSEKYINSIEAVALAVAMLIWTVIDNRKKAAGPSIPSEKITIPISIALFSILFSGCAINKPKMREEIIGTNGVKTVRELSATSWAFWPATQTIDKQKVTLGKTFSVGTDGVVQETGSTNVADTVRALSDLVKGLR